MKSHLIHIVHLNRVVWIVIMEDLHDVYIQVQSILSIIVVTETANAASPNVMDCRFGRSMHHSNIQYHINTSNHK